MDTLEIWEDISMRGESPKVQVSPIWKVNKPKGSFGNSETGLYDW